MGVSAQQQPKEQQQQQHIQYEEIFCRGKVVEVSSDEDGFQDAWFIATVLRPPPPSSSPSSSTRPTSKGTNSPNRRGQSVYVEYKTLFFDDGFSRPLKELVPVRFVRPQPPVDLAPPSFELYDVVDAYYRDGWWTGVITSIFQDSRFVVTFQNPPDELEVGPSDLRVHLDWVNGTWVRPQKQKRLDLMYSLGKKVEVLDEDEYAWLPSTIIENRGNRSFLVEYQIKSNEPQFHRVTVDHTRIRPCPPPAEDKNLSLLDKVDAFYDFRWRCGVITKVLEDNRFAVFFYKANITKEFNKSDLRPRLEWLHGKWLPSEETHSFGRNPDSEGINRIVLNHTDEPLAKRSEEKPLKTKKDRKEKSSSGIENSSHANTLPNYLPAVSSEMLLHCVEKLKIGVDAANPSLVEDQHETTSSRSPLSKSNGVNSQGVSLSGDQLSDDPSGCEKTARKVSLDVLCRNGDQPSGNGSWGKKCQRKRQKIDGEEPPTLPPKRKLGRPLKLLDGTPQSSSGSLECVKMSGESHQLYGEEDVKLDGGQRHQINNPSVDNKEMQTVDSSQKKRRGRPRKFPLITELHGSNRKEELIVKDNITSEVDSHTKSEMLPMSRDGSAPYKEILMDDGSGENANENRQKQKKELCPTVKVSPVGFLMEKDTQGLIRDPESHSSRRAKRRTSSVHQNALIQDGAGRKAAEASCGLQEVNVVVGEGPNILDDQPLSKWLLSPGTVDSARISPGRTMDQSMLFNKRHKGVSQTPASGHEGMKVPSQETVEQSTKVDKPTVVSIEPEDLPFVKNTSLWAVIESMEVFRKMPQKPHFRPLLSYKESSREGFAIASMVTFSSTVEHISKLQFDDPREKIDDILDSLNDMEKHGFSVEVLRERINELLSIKAGQSRSNDELAEIRSQIDLCNLDKAEKNAEIVEVQKQIQELQEKVRQLESVKETKDHEIASLQSKLDSVEESIKNARISFEVVATGVL